MSHTMKIWERIIEHHLRRVTNITENQFKFMTGRSTMEAIFLIRQLIERCREQKNLHMIFIMNVIWWALQKHKVSSKYITLIKDMYDNVVTSVRISDGDTYDFSINIGLHQGSTLNHYLFALVMNDVTRDVQCGIPWYLLFIDDVILVDESRTEVDQKLELWRRTLETKIFKFSRSKTKYMKCDFSATIQEEGNVRLNGQVVPKKDIFRYLESMLQKNGDIDKDVSHKIKAD
jgi:hypothetical protein